MKKEEKRETTKKKILNAFFHIILKKGFSRATTREIAKEAGVSEGAIFYHFKDKQNLFESMIDEYSKDLRRHFEVALSYTQNPYKKLIHLIELHIERFISNDSILNLVFGPTGVSESYNLSVIFNRAINPYIEFVGDIFESGIKKGIFIEEDAVFLASALLGMANVFCIRVMMEGEDSVGGREELNRVLKSLATRAFLREQIT